MFCFFFQFHQLRKSTLQMTISVGDSVNADLYHSFGDCTVIHFLWKDIHKVVDSVLDIKVPLSFDVFRPVPKQQESRETQVFFCFF